MSTRQIKEEEEREKTGTLLLYDMHKNFFPSLPRSFNKNEECLL
jgi:hypothetical protein